MNAQHRMKDDNEDIIAPNLASWKRAWLFSAPAL